MHNEPNGLGSSPNIIRAIKSRGIRWSGRVTRTAERGDAYGVLVGNLTERDHLEDLGIAGGGGDNKIELEEVKRGRGVD